MAANGISTLQYKRDRQEAKLDLASQNRAAQGKPDQYDLDLLPTVYAPENNNTNDVIDNPNPGGLQQGRPWVQ